jgi:hypothetical protein
MVANIRNRNPLLQIVMPSKDGKAPEGMLFLQLGSMPAFRGVNRFLPQGARRTKRFAAICQLIDRAYGRRVDRGELDVNFRALARRLWSPELTDKILAGLPEGTWERDFGTELLPSLFNYTMEKVRLVMVQWPRRRSVALYCPDPETALLAFGLLNRDLTSMATDLRKCPCPCRTWFQPKRPNQKYFDPPKCGPRFRMRAKRQRDSATQN